MCPYFIYLDFRFKSEVSGIKMSYLGVTPFTGQKYLYWACDWKERDWKLESSYTLWIRNEERLLPLYISGLIV